LKFPLARARGPHRTVSTGLTVPRVDWAFDEERAGLAFVDTDAELGCVVAARAVVSKDATRLLSRMGR